RVDAAAAQAVAGAGLVGGVGEDVDRFALVQVVDDVGVDPGDGVELAGPVVGVVRPGEPRRLVRLPLGGHAQAGGRRGVGTHRGGVSDCSPVPLPVPVPVPGFL